MTVSASKRLPIHPRWGHSLWICPIWRTFWTHRSDMSIAWTCFGDVSISTSFLDMFRLAAAQCRQMQQAVRLDELTWASLEEIGHGA